MISRKISESRMKNWYSVHKYVPCMADMTKRDVWNLVSEDFVSTGVQGAVRIMYRDNIVYACGFTNEKPERLMKKLGKVGYIRFSFMYDDVLIAPNPDVDNIVH